LFLTFSDPRVKTCSNGLKSEDISTQKEMKINSKPNTESHNNNNNNNDNKTNEFSNYKENDVKEETDNENNDNNIRMNSKREDKLSNPFLKNFQLRKTNSIYW